MSRKISLIVLALFLMATPALAGPLAGHANAIPGFTGSTPFAFGTLTGYVDYAVFLPGDYPGYANYTPTPGELAYTYQVYVTGTAPVTVFTVDIDPSSPVDNIGYFFDGDGTQIPFDYFFVSGGAEWDFDGIVQGDASVGLAFSSPNLPVDYTGNVVDTGQSAFVIPLPSPGPVPIPEPSTLVLGSVAVGLGLLLARRRRS